MVEIVAPITILKTIIQADIATGMRGETGVGATGPITRRTSNDTINPSWYQWNGNTDGGSFTFLLPAGIQDTPYRIVNTGTSGNQLTITPDGSEKLIGVSSSFVLDDGASLIIGWDSEDHWY